MSQARIIICLLTVLASLPTVNGAPPIRWLPWQKIGLSTSYFNPIHHGKVVELWFGANFRGQDSVIGLAGGSFVDLKKTAPRFNSSIVEGYDRHRPKREHPILSRSSTTRLQGGAYLTLASIGPSYEGGGSELYPALFYSSDGKAGHWKHLGPPSGEPEAWLKAARQRGERIRSDGGSIIQTEDGGLAMYTHGYGTKLCLARAKSVEGPWVFHRDASGNIVDLVANLKEGKSWIFPHVIEVPGALWLTGGDAWPPKEIRMAVSEDGESFTWPSTGPTPILTAEAMKASSVKVLRLAWDPQKKILEALCNPWNPKQQRYDIMASKAKVDLKALMAQE